MELFLGNLIIALIWAAMLGEITLFNLFTGFALGYLLLRFLSSSSEARPGYFLKAGRGIRFAGYCAWEIFKANLRVAHEVVSFRLRARPGIVAIPLDAESNYEICLLAALITLTPGSTTIDISDDRRVLYAHIMFVDDPETARREIKDGFERRILELSR
jgi:multicomponent Na+:H+ antiporter subunit E